MEKGLQACFREHISEHFPQLKSGGGVFLLAFSGGADSTVLGELLFAEGVRVRGGPLQFPVFAGMSPTGMPLLPAVCPENGDASFTKRISIP